MAEAWVKFCKREIVDKFDSLSPASWRAYIMYSTMLDAFTLRPPPLDHLTAIVRGADTNRHDLAPEAAGLLAASLGLSRIYQDDLAQLDAAMGLYDAFYRWARDATDEGHDWPASSAGG